MCGWHGRSRREVRVNAHGETRGAGAFAASSTGEASATASLLRDRDTGSFGLCRLACAARVLRARAERNRPSSLRETTAHPRDGLAGAAGDRRRHTGGTWHRRRCTCFRVHPRQTRPASLATDRPCRPQRTPHTHTAPTASAAAPETSISIMARAAADCRRCGAYTTENGRERPRNCGSNSTRRPRARRSRTMKS